MNTITKQLADALRAIIEQRDYHAEHGKYRPGTMGEDQCFDDWAADIAETVLAAYDAPAARGEDNANALADIQRQRADAAERRVEELRELCGDMLKVFEAARPLVLNLERLRDAAHN